MGGGVPGPGGVPGLKGVPGLGGVAGPRGGVPGPGGVPDQVLPPCGQTHACKKNNLSNFVAEGNYVFYFILSPTA